MRTNPGAEGSAATTCEVDMSKERLLGTNETNREVVGKIVSSETQRLLSSTTSEATIKGKRCTWREGSNMMIEPIADWTNYTKNSRTPLPRDPQKKE